MQRAQDVRVAQAHDEVTLPRHARCMEDVVHQHLQSPRQLPYGANSANTSMDDRCSPNHASAGRPRSQTTPHTLRSISLQSLRPVARQ